MRDLSASPDPGEEFNCRCWAEFVSLEEVAQKQEKQKPEGLTQEVTSSLKQKENKWTDEEFKNHFWNGNGRGVTLAEIGWKVDVIEHAKKIMFHRVENQLTQKVRQVQSGKFSDTWEQSYNFQEVVFSLGKSVIRGRFEGTVIREDNILIIDAKAYYLLDDEFTDPLSIRQNTIGTSNRDIIPDNVFGDAIMFMSDGTGTPYPITETWITKITGSIKSTN